MNETNLDYTDIMAVRRAMREAYDEECAHPTKDPEPAAGAPNVYDYCLTDKPDVWRILICPGDGLDEATRIVEDQFGAERVLAVRVHEATLRISHETG